MWLFLHSCANVNPDKPSPKIIIYQYNIALNKSFRQS